MSDQRLKIAVFIDFDNVEIGVKTTLGRQFDVGAVLEAIKERGEIITKVAYGDWKHAGDHSRAMAQHAVRLVQRVMTPGGDKNGADINLALDALEMAFTHDHINAFVIVGGDSDFITLVEKLKQYDKKVFVVGGRAFTSQVMQKNCTEFIAYENVAGHRVQQRTDRTKPSNGGAGPSSLDQAVPLVRRALKVLSDREVSPQLGLLKSTLLQLDSSFSERDYGASTFRDFAEKLEQRGLVTLKHSGRTTLVELTDERGGEMSGASDRPADSVALAPTDETPVADAAPKPASRVPQEPGNVAEGVALFRAVLGEAATPPRFPMYLRQVKQFIRSARPDFDERRYGSIVDVMRAAQKEGLVRVERDRQGALRVFSEQIPSVPKIVPADDVQPVGIEPVIKQRRGSVQPNRVPHGWSILGADADNAEAGDEAGDADANGNQAPAAEGRPPTASVDASDEAKPSKPRRTRKAVPSVEAIDGGEAAEKPKRARKAPAAKPRAEKRKR